MGSLLKRALIVTACLLAGAAVLARASQSEVVPVRTPLNQLPMQLADWRGQRLADFDEDVLAVLGVDEYVNRAYYSPTSLPISLYVGFYESQRQGDTMHSPLNCLPGAGWIPLDRQRILVPVREGGGERQVEVNSLIIEKGLDRQAVIYWYQSHGRVVASEYWGRAYMVLDAIRTNRTDGAMVRVIVPIGRSEATGPDVARQTGIRFVQELFPILSGYLPA